MAEKMPVSVAIRDKKFIRRVESERRRRGHKTLARTARELSDERMTELKLGVFIPADSQSAVTA